MKQRYVALVYACSVIFGWYKLKVEDASHFWVSMNIFPPLHAHDFDVCTYFTTVLRIWMTSLVPRSVPFLPSVCILNNTQERKTGEFYFSVVFCSHVLLWMQLEGKNGNEVKVGLVKLLCSKLMTFHHTNIITHQTLKDMPRMRLSWSQLLPHRYSFPHLNIPAS